MHRYLTAAQAPKLPTAVRRLPLCSQPPHAAELGRLTKVCNIDNAKLIIAAKPLSQLRELFEGYSRIRGPVFAMTSLASFTPWT
jgi:hypothetical protein